MQTPRLLCVSVDLDPIRCYYGLHALGAPPPGLADVILRRALPRFLEIFARHGIRATIFVVGEDLHGPGAAAKAARALLVQAASSGHELGNHTFTHPYALTRLSPAQLGGEIERAHAAIFEIMGIPPRGFRAPGYGISAEVFAALERLGYRYDSSMFPAPGYWAAKAAVMGAQKLLGRESGAVLTDPRGLLAPPEPYRPSSVAPWRRGHSPLVELPIAVTPVVRIPVIGPSLLVAPDIVRTKLLDAMRKRRFFNLELHGIDLIDAEEDGVPAALTLRQPDLRVSLAVKERALEATLGRLCLEYEVTTLEEAARIVAV